ncbi:hypothetical protein PLUTE_a2628 [Pseudoalteromonas luteoviolacea DSM 6061]|nr:hypothetical protein [Pseudoalteromonas luteoviolacea DSM 6061]
MSIDPHLKVYLYLYSFDCTSPNPADLINNCYSSKDILLTKLKRKQDEIVTEKKQA